MHMHIGQIVHFHNERFFEGAVQLRWLQRRHEQAQQAAEAFVFHGPRYHGASEAEREGIDAQYQLKDTASFVRDLLDSMQAGAEGRETNPYWLVVAGYGSGKSHLALTCGHLLAHPHSPTAHTILEQITRADAAIGAAVTQQLHAQPYPALVLPLDGMAGFHLGNALSRAVFAQLQHHGVDAGAIRDLSPRFQTAEQFVQRNYAVRTPRFQELLPGSTAEAISARLREHDETVYTAVDALYNESNGHPIPVEGQESAQELIDTLCREYCGASGPFSHVIILFDELGRYLEYAADKPQLAGDFVLQQIFQGIQDNSKARFVGFVQYELKAYLKRFSSADSRQLQRYVTRFDAADKWYLSTNLETIFAHIISKQADQLQQLWQETDAAQRSRRTWQRLTSCLPGFQRFPVWHDPEKFERIIAQGCWPLHPLTVWLLTRQRDLVQSRSALTFVRDTLLRVANEAAHEQGGLRQISAAELLIENLLPQLVAAERETGGNLAETLSLLLEKFAGHLSPHQQRVLAGVAVLEKIRIGKQQRDHADALLSEASGLDAATLPQLVHSLSELGALEWNADLGQYELLSDGATRGQFQQWLRNQQNQFNAAGIRDLFLRRGMSNTNLTAITPDFALSKQITTPDWFFEAQLAHASSVSHAIQSAFKQWHEATLPKDAKGKVIYLYLHPDDDLSAIDTEITRSMDAELKRYGQKQAPIWVIGLVDRQAKLAEHLARLHILDERITEADRERFRRFIPKEDEHIKMALQETIRAILQDRCHWIAGFTTSPAGRQRVVAAAIFAQVYPHTIPFPFDGFATANGGGAVDVAQLMRGLITRQINGSWVQSQPRRLQNRVHTVLVQSWRALLPSGKLAAPANPAVHSLLTSLEQAHQQNPNRTLRESYNRLLAPPYGLNASSAGLLLALLLGLDSPPRRIEQDGELFPSGDWINQALPGKHGRYLDPSVLETTRLRFLTEDSEAQWRRLLNQWEAESQYQRLVELAREAEKRRAIDPLPESLEGHYHYLRDRANQAQQQLRDMSDRIKQWEREIEIAIQRESIPHAIRFGSQIAKTAEQLATEPQWPDGLQHVCEQLLTHVGALLEKTVDDWIPRQFCNEVAQVADFRRRTEQEAKGLTVLGFSQQAEQLTQQAQTSIHRVEQRQQFKLTLDQCQDYPRQPPPQESTPVRTLRDGIRLGDELIERLQETSTTLSPVEINAHTQAIRQRQAVLQAMLKRHTETLGKLYALDLGRHSQLQEAMSQVNRLRDIFIDTRDASEVGELAVQLEQMLSDVAAWDFGEVAVERLEDVLNQQVHQQLAALTRRLDEHEIEPAWDLQNSYAKLQQERVAAAQQRSAQWVSVHLVADQSINHLDRAACCALIQELSAAPAYLAAAHREQVHQQLTAAQARLAELEEQQRSATLRAWQQRVLDDTALEGLDRLAIEQRLQQLHQPPCTLRPEEHALLAPITHRLTARLDQLSLDELFSRITRLTTAQQRELLQRLKVLVDD